MAIFGALALPLATPFEFAFAFAYPLVHPRRLGDFAASAAFVSGAMLTVFLARRSKTSELRYFWAMFIVSEVVLSIGGFFWGAFDSGSFRHTVWFESLYFGCNAAFVAALAYLIWRCRAAWAPAVLLSLYSFGYWLFSWMIAEQTLSSSTHFLGGGA